MDTPEPSETGAAKVSVVSAIVMPGLDTFLVLVDVLSGVVRPGMDLVVAIGSTAERNLRIHGVGPALDPNGVRVGLAFEAVAWDRLAGLGDRAMTDGTVLQVRDPAT